jgi:two-component system sensor histidine kinase BaeS
LRAREFAAISLAIVAAVAITLILAVVLVRRSVRHQALSSLGRQAALLAAQQRATQPASKSSSLGVFFASQQETEAILELPQAELLLPPQGAAALRAGRPVQGSVQVHGQNYLYAARPQGRQAIVLLRSTKLAAADLRPFTIAFIIAAAVGAGLAAIAAFFLARAVARPIERVAAASRALAAGERSDPLPVTGSTELAALSQAFNQLAEDLEHARDAERSFLLSVSHELKTPLASIRGHGEALLDGVMEVRPAATVVVSESQRLERLVRDLLDLARLNQKTFTALVLPVDLAQLVAEAIRRHEVEARRVGVTLTGDSSGAAPALADPDRVLQVLSNLIENALRSTASGGSVTVSAEPGELTVADTGPGLDVDELPRAFERFYLYSRYAAHRAVGTGLGLAIVKELVEVMNGRVTVESVRGRGTTFVVSLPLVPASPAGAETGYRPADWVASGKRPDRPVP